MNNFIEGICRPIQEHNISNDEEGSIQCDNDEANHNLKSNETARISDNNCNILSLLENSSCFICNGYYGPCFEDPLCATCHAFLYPIDIPQDKSKLKSSSGSDSGNEELDLDYLDYSDNDELLQRLEAGSSKVRYNNESLTKQLSKLCVYSPKTDHISVEYLPIEVLMHTFQYLDEISLWSIGQVCTRWREILFMCVKPERWRAYILSRWPLLPLDGFNQSWYDVYTSMMLSVCCVECVRQMASQEISNNNWDSNWRMHRLLGELRAMQHDPLDGISAKPLDATCGHWQATIEGPTGSPYEGGLFFLYIQVPEKYPLNPPIVRFISKIFHPNVSRHGDIGIDSIRHNWSLALTLSKLLISIQSLLTDPYCEVCMEPDIGNLYKINKRLFDEKAKEWTVRYAMLNYRVDSPILNLENPCKPKSNKNRVHVHGNGECSHCLLPSSPSSSF